MVLKPTCRCNMRKMKLSLAVARLSIAPVRNSRRKAGIRSNPVAPPETPRIRTSGRGGCAIDKEHNHADSDHRDAEADHEHEVKCTGQIPEQEKCDERPRYRTGSVESPVHSEGGGEIPALSAQGYQRVPGRRSDALSRDDRARSSRRARSTCRRPRERSACMPQITHSRAPQRSCGFATDRRETRHPDAPRAANP